MTTVLTHTEKLGLWVEKLDREGWTIRLIAEKLGITTQRVEQILDRLDGLSPETGLDVVVTPTDIHLVPGTPDPDLDGETKPVIASSPVSGKKPRQPAVHGTYAGYMRHATSKQRPGDWDREPCDPCRNVKRAYDRDRRLLKRVETGTTQPTAAPPAPVAANDATPPKQRIRVRWLVLPGERQPAGTHREFGVATNGHINPISDTAAELAADDGVTVYRRTVTDWAQVTDANQ